MPNNLPFNKSEVNAFFIRVYFFPLNITIHTLFYLEK